MEDPAQLDLYIYHRLAILCLSLSFAAAVFELIRRGLLKERYALLWLSTSFVALLFGAFPRMLVFLAQTFHFQYLTVILMLSFLFTLGLVLSFTIIMSRLSDRNRRLTQEVALLTHAVQRLEKRLDGEQAA